MKPLEHCADSRGAVRREAGLVAADGLDHRRLAENAGVVLQQVREPSQAMIEAGMAVAYGRVIDLYEEDVRAIFQAMIDAVETDL